VRNTIDEKKLSQYLMVSDSTVTRTLVGASLDSVVPIDLKSSILMVNKEGMALARHESSEDIGGSIHHLLPSLFDWNI
jgi:hypothetical protein